ncbi:MAG: MBL fold metallo-hydrolase [Chitinivibrionales bacterium]|nr:MBL fold metallo-hydrolase [Chitinivibrionales bacterium]
MARTKSGIRIWGINTWLSAVFAVETESAFFLIDTSLPGSENAILAYLKKINDKPIRTIILTHSHFDHFGSAQALRQRTGAAIAVFEADARALTEGKTEIPLTHGWGTVGKVFLPLAERIMKVKPVKADIILKNNDELNRYGLPARVIHTPGHTIGSLTVLLEQDIAFVGDLVVAHPWPQAQCYFANDWRQLADSLKKMQQLKPSVVYTGHSCKPIDSTRFQNFKPFFPKGLGNF